jgi:hypothetical protein
MNLQNMVDIASFSPDVWYKLTTIYSEFHDYAYSRAGVMKYRELFVMIDIFRVKTKYHYIDGILQKPPSL